MKYSVIQIITMATLIFVTVAILIAGYRLMQRADDTLNEGTVEMKQSSDLIINTEKEKYVKIEGGCVYGYRVKLAIAKYPTTFRVEGIEASAIKNSDTFSYANGVFTYVTPTPSPP